MRSRSGEIAAAAVYVASDAATVIHGIHGATLAVDGGRVAA